MTQDLDARIAALRSRRDETCRKAEADLADMQAALERQVATFRKEVSEEAKQIGGIMQVTRRRVTAAEKRQAELEEKIAALEDRHRANSRLSKRLSLALAIGGTAVAVVILGLVQGGAVSWP